MPRMNIDYSKIVIYKIVCNDLSITDCYVGMTSNLRNRRAEHKKVCHNPQYVHKYGYKLYEFIRNNHGWENWSVVEIEKWPCNDGNEARARERYWYEHLNATLNSYVPNKSC